MNLPIPIKIFVVWKRGPKRVETKQRLILDNNIKKAIFNEKLSLLATLYKKPEKDHFQ